MKIAMANDHAAVAMKNEIKKMLEEEGYEVINFGTDTNDSVDYPDFGSACARAVANKEADFGIVICGTGIGISIAANKIPGIRCGLCKDVCIDEIIEMEDGKPKWTNDRCSHCMGCISRCPKEAIQYGKVTQKRVRYVNSSLK